MAAFARALSIFRLGVAGIKRSMPVNLSPPD